MGRGIGTRDVLPFSEVPASTVPALALENILQLPFVDASLLELQWDDLGAVLLLLRQSNISSAPAFKRNLTRSELRAWLGDVLVAVDSLKGSITFGDLNLSWGESTAAPSLYKLGVQQKEHLGTLASWDVIRTFLREARDAGLF